MSTIDVKDAGGNLVPVEKPNPNGRALAAASRSTAMAIEDKAVLDRIAANTTAATSTPVTGTLAATGQSAAFTPQLARPIMLTLSGTWAGTAKLLRSIDGGTTKMPLTVGGSAWGSFTANCQEAIWEETEAAATFYVDFTRTSGTLAYRVSQ